MLSDAEQEYDEMLLKAQPLLDAAAHHAAAIARRGRASGGRTPPLSGR